MSFRFSTLIIILLFVCYGFLGYSQFENTFHADHFVGNAKTQNKKDHHSGKDDLISLQMQESPEMEIVYDLIPVTGIEFSSSMNAMTQHPFERKIGYGFQLGYWLALTEKRHYVGVDVSYHRYRFNFTYPNNGLVVSNYHDIYTLPLYYGFNITTFPTKLSVEVGANFLIHKDSEGVLDENYFLNEVGTSFISRLKFEYILLTGMDVFARVGTVVYHKNWHIHDEPVIKPIFFTFDLGVSKTFD